MSDELEQLRQRCDSLEDRLDRIQPWVVRVDLAAISDRERLDAVEHQLHDLLATDGDAPTSGCPGWQYSNVYEWVEQWFVVEFARADNQNVFWCPRWHEHPEALLRLTALWRAWETLRRDTDRGMATWLRDFADPQFEQVTNPIGTFRFCKRDRHVKIPPALPVEAKDA